MPPRRKSPKKGSKQQGKKKEKSPEEVNLYIGGDGEEAAPQIVVTADVHAPPRQPPQAEVQEDPPARPTTHSSHDLVPMKPDLELESPANPWPAHRMMMMSALMKKKSVCYESSWTFLRQGHTIMTLVTEITRMRRRRTGSWMLWQQQLAHHGLVSENVTFFPHCT